MSPRTKPVDLLYDCPEGHTLRPELICCTGIKALPACPIHELVCEVRPGPSLLPDRDIKPVNVVKKEVESGGEETWEFSLCPREEAWIPDHWKYFCEKDRVRKVRWEYRFRVWVGNIVRGVVDILEYLLLWVVE